MPNAAPIDQSALYAGILWCVLTRGKMTRAEGDSLQDPGPLYVYGGCAEDDAVPGALVSEHCMQRCQRPHALAPHKCWQPRLIPQAGVLRERQEVIHLYQPWYSVKALEQEETAGLPPQATSRHILEPAEIHMVPSTDQEAVR